MSEEPVVPQPELRDHDYYIESDLFTVIDVDGVDRFFATRTGENEVRIDFDGANEPSSDIGERGDRIQVSVWVPRDTLLEYAERVRQQDTPGDGDV